MLEAGMDYWAAGCRSECDPMLGQGTMCIPACTSREEYSTDRKQKPPWQQLWQKQQTQRVRICIPSSFSVPFRCLEPQKCIGCTDCLKITLPRRTYRESTPTHSTQIQNKSLANARHSLRPRCIGNLFSIWAYRSGHTASATEATLGSVRFVDLIWVGGLS